MIWIVSHDAGGAEILSSWAKRQEHSELKFVLEGPACRIFERKLGAIDIEPRESLRQAEAGRDRFLTGTGWASDLEKFAVQLGTERRVWVITFLDHWVRYRERFETEGKLVLPNEIWVGDDDAFALARATFPEHFITKVENPYFADMRSEIKALENLKQATADQNHPLRILYACEALTEHHKRLHEQGKELPEFEAIRGFLAWLRVNENSAHIEKIRFRPHPAEASGKYDAFLDDLEIPVEISPNSSLAEDCAWSDWVVGMGSMALVIGLIAEKKVYSRMPKGSGKCPLPQKEITHIPN